MWSKKQQIWTREGAMGKRLVEERRLFNQQLLRLEGGSATMHEFVDNVLDDVVGMQLRAGGEIKTAEVQRAKKETKWLLTLMYEVFRDTYVYMTKAGETIVLTNEVAQHLQEWKEDNNEEETSTYDGARQSTRRLLKGLFRSRVYQGDPAIVVEEKEALSHALEEEETKEFEEQLQTQGWYGKAKMYAGRWLSKLWGFFKKHWILLTTVGLFAASYYCANTHNKVKTFDEKAADFVKTAKEKVSDSIKRTREIERKAQEAKIGTPFYFNNGFGPMFAGGEKTQDESWNWHPLMDLFRKVELSEKKPSLRGTKTTWERSNQWVVQIMCTFINEYIRGGWNYYTKKCDDLSKNLHYLCCVWCLDGHREWLSSVQQCGAGDRYVVLLDCWWHCGRYRQYIWKK